MRVQSVLDFLAVAVGGAAGSMARYALSIWLPRAWGGSTVATLLVNLVGCLGIGYLIGHLEAGGSLSPRTEALIRVGLLGGLTTYSTFAADLYSMNRQNHWLLASSYLLAHLFLGLLALAVGIWLGRTWLVGQRI
jgi:CrcB protein